MAPRVPAYFLHKGSGQGCVKLNGRFHYLGAFNTPESRRRYDRLVAEWLAHGRQLPADVRDGTVLELIAAYWNHCETYYRKADGSPSGGLGPIKYALRPVRRLYADYPIREFGPNALKAVRDVLIREDRARKTINQYVTAIRGMFRWAVENELCEPSVLQALQAVAPLRKGRTEARESEPKALLDSAHIEAVQPFLPLPVAAMVQLQWLTAARGGEIRPLRRRDVRTDDSIWFATLADHKTAHRGLSRVLCFGPTAQAVLDPFMERPVDAPLFSPREGYAEMMARGAKSRRRPDQPPSPRKTNRRIGETYDKDSYRKAIIRGCDAAGVPRWTPHQLRHARATMIRERFGLEAAQAVLGHESIEATQIYAAARVEVAAAIAAQIG